mmetsp:Transcript_17641/g.50515  ORF Transcript_17641/g.50515 Transcript_17641/m.50515 type:complete len:274 (-) Transcript_17641:161-982(-)
MDEHGDAANVEGGDVAGDVGLQDVARGAGLANKVGDEHHQLHSGWERGALRHPSGAGVNSELDATVNGRGDVVGMALDGSGNLQQSLGSPARQSVSSQDQTSDDSTHNGSTGAAQSSGVRDATYDMILESRHGLVGCIERRLDADAHEVGLVLGHLGGALALGRDLERVRPGHRNFRPQIDRHADAVVARPHVGRRRRDADRDGIARRPVLVLDGHPGRYALLHLLLVLVRHQHRRPALAGLALRILKDEGGRVGVHPRVGRVRVRAAFLAGR